MQYIIGNGEKKNSLKKHDIICVSESLDNKSRNCDKTK